MNRYRIIGGRKNPRPEHRVIAEKTIGRKLRPGEVVHHIDGNPLNNRPENLQVCASIAEHLAIHHRTDLVSGRWKKPGRSSRFPGVHLCKKTGLWRAMMSVGNKTKHLGRFKSERMAYNAYKSARHDAAGE